MTIGHLDDLAGAPPAGEDLSAVAKKIPLICTVPEAYDQGWRK